MKRPLIIASALAAAALCGCAVQPIDPSKPATVGSITVDPQLSWANIRIASGNGSTWTVDGLGLDELRFFSGIQSGQALTRAESDTMPKYDSTMLPDDVAELFAGTLGRAGFRQVKTSGLAPKQFGSKPGFVFNVTATTPDGLEMKGLVLASQHEKQLDAMLFVAPREYYYDRYAGMIEKLFDSARLTP